MLFSRLPYHCIPLMILLSLGAIGVSGDGRAGNDAAKVIRTELGQELARLWCRQCHVISPEGTGLAQIAVPTFVEIANRPGQTIKKTEFFLADPHPPMPNLSLTRDESLNLATYIISLKQENGN